MDLEDNTALFGEGTENRWNNFVKNHVVKDAIIYEDKDKNYRLMPNALPFTEDMKFVNKNFS